MFVLFLKQSWMANERSDEIRKHLHPEWADGDDFFSSGTDNDNLDMVDFYAVDWYALEHPR